MMLDSIGQRYFVRKLEESDYKPLPEAEFEIQILNENGEGEHCAYIGGHSDKVIALIHLSTKGPIALEVESCAIPTPVILAARARSIGYGEHVDERGVIIRPF